jgi:hypothetical protein
VPEKEVISNGPSINERKELFDNLSQQYFTLPTAEATETAVSWYGDNILVRAVTIS